MTRPDDLPPVDYSNPCLWGPKPRPPAIHPRLLVESIKYYKHRDDVKAAILELITDDVIELVEYLIAQRKRK